MSRSPDCPDDDQLREYAAGRLRAESFSAVATHLQSCMRCRSQVFAGEPTIEDDGPHGFRFDLTGDTLSDAEKTNPQTAYDPDLDRGDGDSAVRYLFPDRQGDLLGWLGDYKVEYELGRGGMGIVFKGFDPHLHRVVAIKMMAPQLAVNERARQRFSREARAVAAINHPNVVTIHAVSEYKDVPYLVMEYVAGESLDDRIKHRRPLPPVEIARIAAQIADGLAAAHAVGVIHRDVKPANVMLENSVDRVKIGDFGLAQVAIDCADLTPTDQVLGTPSYMAPEQVEGRNVDERADLFSLGCVMYAMVVGHSPFIGSHMLDVVRRVSDFDPKPLDEVDPTFPAPLSALVSRLLEKDPDDRLQSAEEAAEALRRLLADRSFESSRKLRPLGRLTPLLARPLSGRRGRGLLKRLKQKNRAFLAGLIGFVAVLGLAGWRWFPSMVKTATKTTRVARVTETGAPLVTVALEGGADFSDLRKAVDQAPPGAVIRILDAGRYEGPIVLYGGRRISDLTIDSPKGAKLFAAERAVAPLEINNRPNVTVRGLRIECAPDQHGIVLRRNVSGTSLEKIRIDQTADTIRAAVYLTNGTHGSPDHPLRLSELDVTAGALGIVIGEEVHRSAITSVRIERSRVRGVGLMLLLEGEFRDVIISENIFTDGRYGLILNLTDSDPAADVLIRNNTFFGLKYWIYLHDSRTDLTNLSIARNLILDCEGVHPSSHDLADVGPRWFHDNVWRTSTTGVGVDSVARVVPVVPLVSTDLDSPDYLRPADRATVTMKAPATGAPDYAGAVAPRPPASPPSP
jgi:serine/threonine protein kinase